MVQKYIYKVISADKSIECNSIRACVELAKRINGHALVTRDVLVKYFKPENKTNYDKYFTICKIHRFPISKKELIEKSNNIFFVD